MGDNLVEGGCSNPIEPSRGDVLAGALGDCPWGGGIGVIDFGVRFWGFIGDGADDNASLTCQRDNESAMGNDENEDEKGVG